MDVVGFEGDGPVEGFRKISRFLSLMIRKILFQLPSREFKRRNRGLGIRWDIRFVYVNCVMFAVN